MSSLRRRKSRHRPIPCGNRLDALSVPLWIIADLESGAFPANMPSVNELSAQIDSLLKIGGQREIVLEQALRGVLKQFHSETGAIHRLDEEEQMLHLAAQVGLPEPMLEVIKTIPVGKGIAGETIAKNRPVTICNLQTDSGGIARPGAKHGGTGGALCVPIRHGNKTVGTLGVGTVREREYSAAEINSLLEIAKLIGEKFV